MADRTCSIAGCSRKHAARGWCKLHYYRWARHGDPLFVRPRLRDGNCAVDGCSSPIYSRRFCQLHYMRQRNTGGPGPVERKSRGSCSVDGCVRPHSAKGLCSLHRRRVLQHGDVGPVGLKRDEIRLCDVDGCRKPAKTGRLCGMHYQRWRKFGDPGSTRRLRAEAGNGRLTNEGYRMLHTGGRQVLEHRVVMEQTLSRPLEPFENVHHRNGIRHDNRPENLELWTKPQPSGQRPEDLVSWVVQYYPSLVDDELRNPRLRLLG